jgi:hypothetical protein
MRPRPSLSPGARRAPEADPVSPRHSSAARLAVSPAGEELLQLAHRAGMDRLSHEELRRAMAVWSKRYRARLAWATGSGTAEDAALVALTVHYLRTFRSSN